MHTLLQMNCIRFLFTEPVRHSGGSGWQKKQPDPLNGKMKLLRSFVFAWNGLRYCSKTQLNFKIHLFLAAMAIFAGICFRISKTEWMIIAFCITMVLVTEMLNTAFEKLSDIVHLAYHPGIKLVKDIAAGAVLIAAFMSAVTGTIIFLPKILIVLKSL